VTHRDELLRAIDALEATLHQSAELADDEKADNRGAGIKLRRLIAEQVAAVGSFGEQAFGEGIQIGTFRQEFSKMRAALASHQATWPIIAINRGDPNYIASVKALRETNRKFIAWARNTLATI